MPCQKSKGIKPRYLCRSVLAICIHSLQLVLIFSKLYIYFRRPDLYEKRKSTIQGLYTALCCDLDADERFAIIITVRKGIKLAGRLIHFLPVVEGRKVVGALLRHMGGMTKKDWQDEVRLVCSC